jgi:hypothetical protein
VERVLFDGAVDISYGQFYLTCAESPGPDGSFNGQINGLCGAAVPGHLYLTTGLNHGTVQVTVEQHTDEPPLPDGWEEIVEASFINTCANPKLEEFDSEGHQLQLDPGTYRVRYCARGMDAASDAESNYDDDVIDTYLLQLWPGRVAADRILRQTSRSAAYWHRAHRTVAPPPEQAAAETAQLDAEEEQWMLRVFQGRVPNARLREVAKAGYSHSLNDIDLDLTFALSEADNDTLRAVAAWAAIRALEIAQLTELPELTPSVTALRSGGRAVPPFDGSGHWYAALTSPIPETPVPPLSPPIDTSNSWDVPEDHTQMRETAAIYAMLATGDQDPLVAALTAINSAASAFGGDLYRGFLADLRKAFPTLPNRA